MQIYNVTTTWPGTDVDDLIFGIECGTEHSTK